MEVVNIANVNIFSGNWKRFIELNKDILFSDQRESLIISSTSVHGVIESQTDSNLMNILNKSYILNPDGRPLVILGKLLGNKLMEQIRGPDVLPTITGLTEGKNLRHFFYGGKEGVAKQLAESLKAMFPNIKIADVYCPPFRELTQLELTNIVDTINKSKADIVWVGLPTPKQEKWANSVRSQLDVKAIYTVGAAFDFQTGNLDPTPYWITSISLEWFYRLVKEPKRLLKRYMKIVPYFLLLSLKQILKNLYK